MTFSCPSDIMFWSEFPAAFRLASEGLAEDRGHKLGGTFARLHSKFLTDHPRSILNYRQSTLWYDRSITKDRTLARPREFDEERVLDAVTDTFWRNGYEATSAQALVDATGLGRGSLYAAYASKDGLFEQALLRYQKQAQVNAEQVRQAGPALQRLREFMQGIVDADLNAKVKRGCLATNSAIEVAGRDPKVAGLVRRNFQILTRGIEDTIRRGQAEGDIRADADAASLALFVFNAVQGLRVMAKTATADDRPKLSNVIDQTLATLT